MMQFNAVQKFYGSHLALDIPDLSVTEGIYWLEGENGSGKTTFLKMIAGLHPFSGDIVLPSCSIKKNRVAFLRLVNYAEAEPLYPPFLTAKDLTELYCKTMKSDPRTVQDLLNRLHILDAYTKPIGTWSSGMIKKLSLALAFTGKPQWILLDEPLITIDTEAVDVICDHMRKLHTENNISFMLTSHQPFQQDKLPLTGKMLAANKTIAFPHEQRLS